MENPAHVPSLRLVAAPQIDPELRRAAVAMANALVEVLSGRLSSQRLAARLDPRPRELLESLCRSERLADLRLRAVRVQQPAPDCLEVSAHVSAGGRSRAAAFRLERRNVEWRVSRLEAALGARQLRRTQEAA